MLQPRLVLGKCSTKWKRLYDYSGIVLSPGMCGGDGVDVHLGDHKSIAHQHAEIVWNSGRFQITCLSSLSSITVDNNKVTHLSPPMPLSSRSIIQIGPQVFYFLLPITTTLSTQEKQIQVEESSHLSKNEIAVYASERVQLRLLKRRRTAMELFKN